MPQDATPNGDADAPEPKGPGTKVAEMQAKLHRWAVADPGRRFDDLFNLVHDPATLQVAFDRVAGNRGARSAGVDGLTVGAVAEQTGVPGFLEDLRAQLKSVRSCRCRCGNAKSPSPAAAGRCGVWGFPPSPTGSSRRH